ncbi:unnamed protein product [Penicillium pancosmium]
MMANATATDTAGLQTHAGVTTRPRRKGISKMADNAAANAGVGAVGAGTGNLGKVTQQQSNPQSMTWQQINATWDQEYTGPIDQAEQLPDGTIKLPDIDNLDKLVGKENWPKWGMNVEVILRSRSLLALIKTNILHPANTPDDATARKWHSASIMVGTWLLNGLSASLYEKVKKGHPNLKFADDVWDTLKMLCYRKGVYSVAEALQAFTKISASEFDNLHAYTNSYLAVYSKVTEAGYIPDPFGSMANYLMGMEKFDPVFSGRLFRQLHTESRESKDFTERYFIDALLDVHLTILSNGRLRMQQSLLEHIPMQNSVRDAPEKRDRGLKRTK